MGEDQIPSSINGITERCPLTPGMRAVNKDLASGWIEGCGFGFALTAVVLLFAGVVSFAASLPYRSDQGYGNVGDLALALGMVSVGTTIVFLRVSRRVRNGKGADGFFTRYTGIVFVNPLGNYAIISVSGLHYPSNRFKLWLIEDSSGEDMLLERYRHSFALSGTVDYSEISGLVYEIRHDADQVVYRHPKLAAD